MAVGNGFDVWFDDGLTDLVVSWSRTTFLRGFEESLSLGAAVERGTAVCGGTALGCEILSWTDWVGLPAELVHLPLCLEHKSHGLINFIMKI